MEPNKNIVHPLQGGAGSVLPQRLLIREDLVEKYDPKKRSVVLAYRGPAEDQIIQYRLNMIRGACNCAF